MQLLYFLCIVKFYVCCNSNIYHIFFNRDVWNENEMQWRLDVNEMDLTMIGSHLCFSKDRIEYVALLYQAKNAQIVRLQWDLPIVFSFVHSRDWFTCGRCFLSDISRSRNSLLLYNTISSQRTCRHFPTLSLGLQTFFHYVLLLFTPVFWAVLAWFCKREFLNVYVIFVCVFQQCTSSVHVGRGAF